eukprot:2558618-Rhodomonas_salina.1
MVCNAQHVRWVGADVGFVLGSRRSGTRSRLTSSLAAQIPSRSSWPIYTITVLLRIVLPHAEPATFAQQTRLVAI